MTNYLISRTVLIFLLNFFGSWAYNTKNQFIQFFNVDDSELLVYLGLGTKVVVLALGLIATNLIFTLIRLSHSLSLDKVILTIKLQGILGSFKLFFEKFWYLLNKNFKHEYEAEKYPYFFIIFAFLILSFSRGNPIFNNYQGIYKEYELEYESREGSATKYVEDRHIILPNNKKTSIRRQIRSLDKDYNKYDSPYKVKKRGYLFIQAGLIDGYKNESIEFKGSIAYIECLVFSALEKVINTLIFFFIPFFIAISFFHFKFQDSNENDIDSMSK